MKSEKEVKIANVVNQTNSIKKIMYVIGVLGLVGSLAFYLREMNGWGTVTLVVGLVFMAVGISCGNDAKRFKKYAPLIFEQNMTSIYDISTNTGHTATTVRSTLVHLINSGALENMTIDDETDKVVFTSGDAANASVESVQASQSQENKSSNCRNCGATLSIGKFCEYCGSAII